MKICYDGTVFSADIGLLVVETEFTKNLEFLPREFAEGLRVGQPIGTFGFPGEIGSLNTTVPLATFKDGTVSAMRPFDSNTGTVTPGNSRIVQHNLDLSGGTSGSPIFDHVGWVVAVNNSGTESLVIDHRTGEPSRVPHGNIGFGIRSDEVWDFIEWLTGTASKVVADGTVPLRHFPRRDYPHPDYQPFPPGWISQGTERNSQVESW